MSRAQKKKEKKPVAGTRGYILGNLTEHFIEEQCDDGMRWCIESYDTSRTTVTASCQRLGTGRKTMDICESGKESLESGVTIRCCDTTLCNDHGLKSPIPSNRNGTFIIVASI
ncbi:unnamed protein product [Caenorhabditis bovis]|uniref:Activin types I and II receptor domain-containing protein n=1 Tax=Caenorhabditis bovis TaxID=2654633 RepID=A0A8S1F3X5_9PELO|nr:unnamed protein product [Caenorhabditis bovis]